MVSRVSLKGLYGRVRLQGLYGRVNLQGLSWGGPNTAQWTVRGDDNFGGTVDSVTSPVCVFIVRSALYKSIWYGDVLVTLN